MALGYINYVRILVTIFALYLIKSVHFYYLKYIKILIHNQSVLKFSDIHIVCFIEFLYNIFIIVSFDLNKYFG